MAGGYAGKILQIDLSHGEFQDVAVDEDTLRKFLGGGGLAAHLFLERFDVHVDPLSPANPLMILAGPLVGTGLPGTSRFAVCARSPLTGIWGMGTCGGTFGPALKGAGFDGVILTGRAAAPVHLVLHEGAAELRPATDLWGRDSYEVTRHVLQSTDPALGAGTAVLAIGVAGEHQVAFASVVNDGSHFVGRTGMGAVMGSKNLKLVTAKGRKRPPIGGDPEAFKALQQRLTRQARDAMTAQSLRSMGTDAGMDLGVMTGDVPVRNWGVGDSFELAQSLGGPALTENHLVRAHACRHCPIACKRVVRPVLGAGPYRDDEGPGPEYETCGAFGTLVVNPNLADVIRANELCNRLGMDTITCGATIAWAMECREHGLLTAEQVDGLPLDWGRMDTVLDLLPRIARREGVGDFLAQGSRAAARALGPEAERFLTDVKGLEAPMHDPRGFHGMGLGYAMSNRGACHLQHLDLYVEQGMQIYTDAGLEESYVGPTSEGKARMNLLAENLGVPAGSACLCVFVLGTMSATDFADTIRLTTGWQDYDLPALMDTGARIWLLQRGVNNLLGVRAVDDRLPERMLTALSDGIVTDSVPDIERMKREYYALRGLDAQGIPTPEVLVAAGLAPLSERLQSLRGGWMGERTP